MTYETSIIIFSPAIAQLSASAENRQDACKKARLFPPRAQLMRRKLEALNLARATSPRLYFMVRVPRFHAAVH